MDENERYTKIMDSVRWWLPVRWQHLSQVYEVKSVELTGDEEDGGADVFVTLNGGGLVAVHFTNEECYGEDVKLAPMTALSRIYSEVV